MSGQYFLNKVKKDHPRIDILINNAGITSDQLFLRMKDHEWDNVLATNLTGTFNLTKAFIKNMIKNRYGRIINISSISGLIQQKLAFFHLLRFMMILELKAHTLLIKIEKVFGKERLSI